MASRHLIQNPKTEKLAGFALFVLGSLLLRDAYDNRGAESPWWSRPFTWW